ncbi:MAG: ribonuclease H family protein [Saprospiraceae bacterium]|jgi:ribonuclease HI
MAKKKYYVVWEGHVPGVFETWKDAQEQIAGYPSAKYKSFGSRKDAEKAFKGSYWAYVGKQTKTVTRSKSDWGQLGVQLNSLAVDAACSGNPGDMEYRGVHISTGKELFRIGPLAEGTNNVGEFLALVHGLALLQKEGKPNMPVYSDSRNAILWIKAKKCRTKLAQTSRNKTIFDMIDRAEKWLSVNTFSNPIIKWDTENWGEIPADFGRK